MAIGTTAAIIGSAALGAGASVLSSRAQSRAINQGAQAQQQAIDRSGEIQRDMFNMQRRDFEPFRQFGMQQANAMGEMFGFNPVGDNMGAGQRRQSAMNPFMGQVPGGGAGGAGSGGRNNAFMGGALDSLRGAGQQLDSASVMPGELMPEGIMPDGLMPPPFMQPNMPQPGGGPGLSPPPNMGGPGLTPPEIGGMPGRVPEAMTPGIGGGGRGDAMMPDMGPDIGPRIRQAIGNMPGQTPNPSQLAPQQPQPSAPSPVPGGVGGGFDGSPGQEDPGGIGSGGNPNINANAQRTARERFGGSIFNDALQGQLGRAATGVDAQMAGMGNVFSGARQQAQANTAADLGLNAVGMYTNALLGQPSTAGAAGSAAAAGQYGANMGNLLMAGGQNAAQSAYNRASNQSSMFGNLANLGGFALGAFGGGGGGGAAQGGGFSTGGGFVGNRFMG